MQVRKNKLLLVLCLSFIVNAFSHDLFGQAQKLKKENNHSAQIKLHNGAPTLFVDGKPAFYGSWWCSAPEVDAWVNAGLGRDYAEETGIHIYAFDVGSEEWCGPGEGCGVLLNESHCLHNKIYI